MIKTMPSVLEVSSYTWFHCNVALGVFFEFSDYIRFIHGTHEYKDIPSPILPSLKTLATALSCLGFYFAMQPYFSIETIFTPEYESYSLGYRLIYYHIAMSAKRFFYYGPFKFTTGAF